MDFCKIFKTFCILACLKLIKLYISIGFKAVNYFFMLLRLFRSNFIFQQFLVLIILGLAISISRLITPAPNFGTIKLSPVYTYLALKLTNIYWLKTIFVLIIFFLQAIIINRLFSLFNLIPRNSFFPALIFILLMGSKQFFLSFNPVLISNLLILAAIYTLFLISKKDNAYGEIFATTVFISLSSFISFNSILFIIFVWLSFVAFRIYSWREWAISLFGILTPYFYYFTYLFLADKFKEKFKLYIEFFSFKILPSFDFKGLDYLVFGIFIFLLILAVRYNLVYLREKVISIRKLYSSMIWFLITGIFICLFSGYNSNYYLGYLFLPASLLISNFLTEIKKTIWIEILFSLLFILVILEQFQIL